MAEDNHDLPDNTHDLIKMSATTAAAMIAQGKLSSETLVAAFLERISQRDGEVLAFAHLDADYALKQARSRDSMEPNGVLHGIPIAIKDTIDTNDFPTEFNSPIYAGSKPVRDAACVAIARKAGAVILGKTRTVEFAAAGRIPATKNPHKTEHGPGGSSNGSAASVADFMTPLALGTQTGGSMIRPASFCGIYAMKPTWGAVSNNGVRVNCPTLDCVGWYGRNVDDLLLLASLYEIPRADQLSNIELSNLCIGLCQSPVWEQANTATQDTLWEAGSRLRAAGVKTKSIDLPLEFKEIPEAVVTMMRGDARVAFLAEYQTSLDMLHSDFKKDVENHWRIEPEILTNAYDTAAICRSGFSDMFKDVDALLTPSAPGEAVKFEEGHGDPIFNVIWSALHAPVINIPGLVGPNDLPIGLSLVGPRYSDALILSVSQVISPILDTA